MSPGVLPRHLPLARLDALLSALQADGRLLIGPTVRDGAVVLDPIEAAADLPAGRGDLQAPGRYRLSDRDDGALFGWVLGPDSLKRWLFPARQRLFRTTATAEGGFTVERPEPPRPLALLGARACDLAAVAIQDRVLRDGAHADPHYASRRSDLLLIAVQCADAASTCFCSSMGSGPRVSGGHDLCLTEVPGPDHHFVVEVGSPAGEALVEALDLGPAGDPAAPERAAEAAAAAISRRLPTSGLRERLLDALDGPHWEDVASRCLGCSNCTMVCPTCFCTQVTDLTDLTGAAERVRTWDSCFTSGHSYVHGGSVRPGLPARYRQWLTHKLATWHDQFGTSGCVGCGRCVTWCPAGIDIVAEAMAAAPPPEDP